MKYLSHQQIVTIDETIREAISAENAVNLMVHTDLALREIVRRRGITVTERTVAYHRTRLGFGSGGRRAKELIKQSRALSTYEESIVGYGNGAEG